MERVQRRINYWYLALLVLAILAVTSRLWLTSWFWLPRFIRHYAADFGFAAFFTVVFTGLFCLLTPARKYLSVSEGWRRALRILHVATAFVGMGFGLNIEREDRYKLDEGDNFDPGALLDSLGARNTDTYDSMDIWVIIAGGIVAIGLQIMSTRRQTMRSWRKFPLLLAERTTERRDDRDPDHRS